MADHNQPIAYIAPSESAIYESDDVIVTGADQGPPVVSMGEQDPIVIAASPWVA